MTTKKLTKLIALYLPYILLGLVATNLGEAWRLAEGKELGDKIMAMMGTFPVAFVNPLPSLHPLDLLIGFSCGAGLRLAVYLRSKEWCFVAPKVIESPSKWERIFPEEDSTNYVIAIPGKSKRRFSALITSVIQDYDMEQHANAFPLYIYEKETIKDDGQLSLFGESEKRTTKWNKRYALSDMILHKYRELYGNKVTKEDIFFYIYAVLQTPSFVDGYADDLSKGVTRIPTLAHFVDYVRIGRELADLHLKYEKPVSAEELGVTIEMHKEDYTVVDRMRFGKGKDKSIIEYNPYITIRNIPTKAYDYIVNGKSAIEWIVEQYAVTTDKASGIVNDPNTYAGGKYIFDLLLSIISVSLKTQELIAQLPEYKEI